MPNRLARETSPYLLQHKDNPLDWYSWGEEAFARARSEDKPVFLSIGYSSCHWCHVMERESFENPQIASLMNQLFVNIKVDREERPDVDSIYMAAVQAMTGHGGWPMSMFLTPDGKPFYAGTYFPHEDRGGMPAFPHVLQDLADAYKNRKDEVLSTTERIVEHLVLAVAVRFSDGLEDAGEGGQAAAVVGREVGAGVERLAVGREEHRHRPAAMAGHRLHRAHVDGVDIRALFAVDLDVDEELVHERGDLLVLERLALHHVAPVAGGVADAEEDRLVLAPRAGEGLLAPGVPVDGVVFVLEKVGAGLARESVGHGAFSR